MGCANSKDTPSSSRGRGLKSAHQLQPQTAQLSERQIEELWPQFIKDMDITADRARDMAALDTDKKVQALQNWITSKRPGLSQTNFSVRYYVTHLRSLRHSRGAGASTGTGTLEKSDLLKSLENSLRTYTVEWLEEFLEEGGLELLIEYLGKTLDDLISAEEQANGSLSGRRPTASSNTGTPMAGGGSAKRSAKRQRQPPSRAGEGDEALLGDLHNGIKCMRVFFNNQRACERTFQDSAAVSIIVQCLLHPRYSTKTFALELLAALCMLDGMHARVLEAFDCLKERIGEARRWETLIVYFRHHDSLPPEQYSIEFMISCARFVNVVQNINNEQLGLRVFLQAEFAQLGLEDFLHSLQGKYEDCRLNSQLEAIADNTIDIVSLYHDSLAKQAAVSRAVSLEDELYSVQARLRRLEDESVARMAELGQRLQRSEAECSSLRQEKDAALARMRHSLRQASQTASDRESEVDRLLDEMSRRLRDSEAELCHHCLSRNQLHPPPQRRLRPLRRLPAASWGASSPTAASAATATSVAGRSSWAEPEGRGDSETPPAPVQLDGAAPNQCRGTIFMDMQPDRVRQGLDCDDFEEKFKLAAAAATSAASTGGDGDSTDDPLARMRKDKPTLLSHDRLRSVAILRHKLDALRLSPDRLVAALDSLDPAAVPTELAEILLRQGVPTAEELQAYRQYEFVEGRSVSELHELDQLLIRLCRVEGLERRLQALRYMGQFEEVLHGVESPLRYVITASMNLEKSAKFKRLLELLLTLGNYLNSHKRGVAYGFRLSSLSMLPDTKSGDKKWTLLHYLVDLIDQQFPDVATFESDLRYVEKAAAVNLDNVKADVVQLLAGMELIRSLSSDLPDNARLREFYEAHKDKAERIKTDLRTAEECFNLAKSRFGEGTQLVTSDAFFGVLHRFQVDVRRARTENEQRRLIAAQREGGDERQQSSKRKQQEEAGRRKARKHTRTIEDGALDDIMSDFSRGALLIDDGIRRKRRTADAPQGRPSPKFESVPV
uniref:FH2 domain-containing protein n=1 Tax=Macrostomum lignano TaxID=282301 RepID=A0A1I8FTM0_9PLAT